MGEYRWRSSTFDTVAMGVITKWNIQCAAELFLVHFALRATSHWYINGVMTDNIPIFIWWIYWNVYILEFTVGIVVLTSLTCLKRSNILISLMSNWTFSYVSKDIFFVLFNATTLWYLQCSLITFVIKVYTCIFTVRFIFVM